MRGSAVAAASSAPVSLAGTGSSVCSSKTGAAGGVSGETAEAGTGAVCGMSAGRLNRKAAPRTAAQARTMTGMSLFLLLFGFAVRNYSHSRFMLS